MQMDEYGLKRNHHDNYLIKRLIKENDDLCEDKRILERQNNKLIALATKQNDELKKINEQLTLTKQQLTRKKQILIEKCDKAKAVETELRSATNRERRSINEKLFM